MSEAAGHAVVWEIVRDGVMLVTMQGPRANALGPLIADGLRAALDEADRRGNIKVVAIASAYPAYFAAGADISHMAGIDGESFAAYAEVLRAVLDRLAGSDRITIAVVEGLALGGGLELAMACTLRVGAAAAQFGLPEVRLGLIPGVGGTQRLPRLVGRARALDIMLTARHVPAEEAKAMGLIDRLVPEGEALTATLALAEGLVAMSHPAQQAVIRTVDAAFDLPLAQGLRFEAEQVQRLFEDGEAEEGLAAFLQKRTPKFA
ncbi:MAG TPA: enoyl-CoA hydratase [Propionibacteriaceae bacterium]|jgi:enoyl-CoA hydratase|nr:enoyl-CoA hydratase [Propionibacteriaceae bacterium]HBY23281.1 enoyl-CoA hydratase [Propionibacteriaceae bacterium]